MEGETPMTGKVQKIILSYFSYFFCAFPSHTCLPLHVCFLFAYKTQKSTCSAGLNYRLINSTCKMNWLTRHLAFGLQYCGLTYRPVQTKRLNIMITVSMETFITKISIHECHWKNFIYDLILNEKHCISIMFLIL